MTANYSKLLVTISHRCVLLCKIKAGLSAFSIQLRRIVCSIRDAEAIPTNIFTSMHLQ